MFLFIELCWIVYYSPNGIEVTSKICFYFISCRKSIPKHVKLRLNEQAGFLKNDYDVRLAKKQIFDTLRKTYEPCHEKMCLMSYANNKGADQPAHPRSLISAFIFRCLNSIISLDSIAKISRL